MAEHIQDEFDLAMSQVVIDAINEASNTTDRSKQQQDFFLGVSNLGHCRQYSVLMTRQTPPSDERPKQAAFFGTVAGEAIEHQLAKMHPDWLFQQKGVVHLPSGANIPGHTDIVVPDEAGVTPEEFLAVAEARTEALQRIEDGDEDVIVPDQVWMQGVYDLKSKAELDTIRYYGMSQQQKYQLVCYAKAMIDEGLLDPTKPIRLADVFFDRSGRLNEAYTIGFWYDEAMLEEIDDWIGDVIYAVTHDEDGSRDKEREFCQNYCEYFTVCRGTDTDAEGLIQDPEALGALETYLEGLKLASEGERMKKSAKDILSKINGSTGTHLVRPVIVEGTFIEGYFRKGYTKLSVTKVPAPKKAKK